MEGRSTSRAAEVQELLGDVAPLVSRRFGIQDDGNAPIDPQEFVGKNLSVRARALGDPSQEFGVSVQAIVDTLDTGAAGGCSRRVCLARARSR